MICKHCTENKRSHNTNSIKPGVNSGAPKGLSVTGGLVAPVVSKLFLQEGIVHFSCFITEVKTIYIYIYIVYIFASEVSLIRLGPLVFLLPK